MMTEKWELLGRTNGCTKKGVNFWHLVGKAPVGEREGPSAKRWVGEGA
jgi:hypothetical protein